MEVPKFASTFTQVNPWFLVLIFGDGCVMLEHELSSTDTLHLHDDML